MPLPLIVRPAPVMVTPLLPERWVNVPAPVVEKFPATFRPVALETLMPAPLKLTLLKLLAPAPLSNAPGPVNVAELVAPVNVPSLVQLPPKEWAKEPPLNVVEAPSTTVPRTVIAAPAVNETEVPEPMALLK